MAEPELDFIHGLDSVHELDAMPRTRRFERSAPEADASRARRFERSGPERRGRFARGEHDATSPRARGARSAAPAPLPAPSRRRTVEITGRTVGAPSLPRLVQIDRRRPARRAAERVGARPDRLALWAVVLGFFLIFVAVTSTSHAATRAHSAGAASGRVVHQQVVPHSHGGAARYPPGALNNRSGRPMRGRSGRVAVTRGHCGRVARRPALTASRRACRCRATARGRIARPPRHASERRDRPYLL